MNRNIVITTVAAGALATAALGFAGAAAAALPSQGSAAETVTVLQSEGYNVHVNGPQDVPLSQCKVTDVHGLSNSNVDAAGHRIDPTTFMTIYVDVSC